jgi:hypothetical protein
VAGSLEYPFDLGCVSQAAETVLEPGPEVEVLSYRVFLDRGHDG